MVYSPRAHIARIATLLLLQAVLAEGGMQPVQLLQGRPNPFLCPRNEKSGEAGYDLYNP